MATRQFPSITIIQNKLLDDKFTITNAQVKDAEREYKDICKVTGRVPEVQSIEEMVESLERGQMKSAKAHAGRVQEAIIFYQKNLKSQSFGDSQNNNQRNTFDDHIQVHMSLILRKRIYVIGRQHTLISVIHVKIQTYFHKVCNLDEILTLKFPYTILKTYTKTF